MALNKFSTISMLCLAAALSFTACAKKNNELTARKNAAGARDINAPTSQAADQQAAAQGFDSEFVKINSPTSTSGGLSVVTRIRLNNNYYDITTNHYTYGLNSQPATATQTIGGATFAVNAVCGNEYCNPYYIIVNMSSGATQIKQMAELKYFYYTGVESQNDVFYSRSAGQFLSVSDAINQLTLGAQQAAAATP